MEIESLPAEIFLSKIHIIHLDIKLLKYLIDFNIDILTILTGLLTSVNLLLELMIEEDNTIVLQITINIVAL